VESSNSVRRPKSKDTKSKNRVLKNTNDRSSSAHDQKMSSSDSIDSNKRETINSTRFLGTKSLIHYPITAKSKNVGATSVVAKSRLSFAKTSTATNKVSSALSLSPDSTHSKTLSNYMNCNKPKVAEMIVDSGCSKHMSGNMKLLRNFVEKFMGTIRFGNDHSVAIIGYGDYVQGNFRIYHVYYVEGLRHNLFLFGKFCDGDLEVAFRSNTCYV
nr:integrase, catalytic region, zinc finger, CCHC-type, peptidase aspartic, catalytic [Tanacetum cinerariifolium]